MPLLSALKSFYGSSPNSLTKFQGAEGSLSFDIVRYAISLMYDPTRAEAQNQALHKLADIKGKERGEALVELYTQVEQELIEHEPVRKFTEISLRRNICRHFELDYKTKGLSLLFVDPIKQEIKLALLFINEIIVLTTKIVNLGQLEELLSVAIKSTPLEHIELTTDGIDMGPVQESLYALPPEQLRLVITDLTKIITLLFEKEVNLEGKPVAIKMFETTYDELKDKYGHYIDGFTQLAIMAPDEVLESEKLGFMSRETLEQKVMEKTKQLQDEKDSIEKQVEERTVELTQERAKLSSSIMSMPLGLLMLDTDHKIILSNPAVPKILGYDKNHWDVSDLIHDFGTNLDLIQSCDEVCLKKQSIDMKQVMFGPKILRLSMYPVLADDSAIGAVVLLEDITEAKVLERSRDEFFSIASHELRTPLTAIKGNSSMITKFYPEVLKDDGLREMIDDIHTSSVRLIEIVNDFLDMSRLEQGKISFKLQPVILDKIIEQVLYEMGPLLKQKNLYFKNKDESAHLGSIPQIFADPDRTKQIIYNLVGNAAKFTESGGITIHSHEENGMLKVTVSDTGNGIPIENQKLLFRKFQQAGSSILTRDGTGGTGLGLYISMLLAEGMGGKVGLESSNSEKGTTFYFTLPLASEMQHATVSTSTPSQATLGINKIPSSLTGKKVLIIEDDPYVQKLYRRLFEHDEWQTELANDGEEGMKKVTVSVPDLILLDIMMPKLNGLETLEILKTNDSTKHVPVLILTNNGESETIAEATRLGASGYLIKSDFAPDQLHEEIKKYLSGSKTPQI